jgi:predicted metalloendopeptidase
MFLIKLLLTLPAGHLYNELGNLEDWWTMKSNSAYEQLSQCFVEQYNNYTLYGKHVSIFIIITIESLVVFNNMIQLLIACAHRRTGLI